MVKRTKRREKRPNHIKINIIRIKYSPILKGDAVRNTLEHSPIVTKSVLKRVLAAQPLLKVLWRANLVHLLDVIFLIRGDKLYLCGRNWVQKRRNYAPECPENPRRVDADAAVEALGVVRAEHVHKALADAQGGGLEEAKVVKVDDDEELFDAFWH